MSEIFSTSKVKIPKHVIFRELDGEAVILNINSGVYFGLDEVGTSTWHLIEKKTRLTKVLESLLEEYQVEKSHCLQDLMKFASNLHKHGLVQIENG